MSFMLKEFISVHTLDIMIPLVGISDFSNTKYSKIAKELPKQTEGLSLYSL